MPDHLYESYISGNPVFFNQKFLVNSPKHIRVLSWPKAGAILILLALSALQAMHAQRPLRIEIPASINASVYRIQPLDEKGLLLFYESNEVNDAGERKWYFSLYDTDLKEEWMQYVSLADGLAFDHKRWKGSKVYILFSTREARRSTDYRFQLLIYDAETAAFNRMTGSLPEKAEVAGFEVGQSHALISLNLPRYQSDILVLNMDNGNLKSVPIEAKGQTIVQAVAYDKANDQFLIAYKEYQNNRFESDMFMITDGQGSLKLKTAFRDQEDRFLHAIQLQYANNQLYAIGSYSEPDRRNLRIREGALETTNDASGLFFLHIAHPSGMHANFYEFQGFDNIYASLSAHDLMRARQRQSRRRSKQDEVPIDVAFQFSNPRLIQHAGEWIYAAEAFRPQYRTETRMDYDFYGRPIPHTYTVFDGYNYFNFLLGGFDANGKLLWSNDFELKNLLTFQKNKQVLMFPDSTGLMMAYNNNGRITSKIIDRNKVTGPTEQVRNETLYPADRIQKENFSGILHWYGHYFITYGYQEIANNQLTNNNLRSVFYLSKLAFD